MGILRRRFTIYDGLFIKKNKLLFHLGDCSTVSRKPNESMRLIVTTFVGVVFGFLIGLSFPTLSLTKVDKLFPLNFIFIIMHLFNNDSFIYIMELLYCVWIWQLNLSSSVLSTIDFKYTGNKKSGPSSSTYMLPPVGNKGNSVNVTSKKVYLLS